MNEKLMQWIDTKVQVVTKGYHLGYAIHKGYLLHVGDDFIELDENGKSILIAIDHISTITKK